MDLLASYSDDGDSAKNTPTRMDQMLPKVESTKSDACLEAEWESFEKMISGTGSPDAQAPPPLPVGPPELSVSSEQSYFSNMSEPPTLSNIKDQTQFFNHADPPTLTNSTEPMTISDDESTSTVTSPQNPLKLTDIILPSQYDDEMPVLTKITGSPLSSEHSRSRSSSSSSRSSSADSVRSEERKKSPSPVSSKRESSPRKDSSNSKRKDEKRDKRSRSRSPHRSRSRSPHRRRHRSSDRKRSRSKSRGRRRSSERKRRSRSHGKRSHHGSSRSHRRRRSGSRTKRRQSREKRSSRDTRRRSSERSHRRDRRDHSKERRRRSRSKERRRSRSRSPARGKKCITRAVGSKPLTFKEQMRQQLLKASKMLSEQADGSEPKGMELPIDTQNNMPLSASSVFASVSAGGNVTPQMALLQTMAAMHQKAQEMTGVAVPRFYNPAAVNPLKYAEQVQKRKLLWGKNKEKKEDEGQGQWQGTAFVSDNDGKMAAKFRKLMGMKEGADKDSDEEKNEEQKKKTEEMFYRLDKEYEFARMTTHTHRGIGLGFQSQGLPNP